MLCSEMRIWKKWIPAEKEAIYVFSHAVRVSEKNSKPDIRKMLNNQRRQESEKCRKFNSPTNLYGLMEKKFS